MYFTMIQMGLRELPKLSHKNRARNIDINPSIILGILE